MKIVAFGHQKRVGKDTASRFVNTEYRMRYRNANVMKRGFASKLKQQCYELYSWAGLGVEEYYEENPAAKEIILPALGKTPRQIWIEYGTLVARVVYPYTWVEYLLNNTKCDLLIVSDLRFPEEAQRIQICGGMVFKIERPSIPHTSDLADDPLLNFRGWDGIITNGGDLADFHGQVIQTVKSYLGF